MSRSAITEAMYLFALLFGSLLACPVPAELVGVHLAEGGADALSQEDLQRDVWLLTDPKLGERRPGTPGYAEGLRRVEARLADMKTLPAFGDEVTRAAGEGRSLCTQRVGKSDRALVIMALDSDDGADASAASIAALVSLAKAWDLPESPRHTLLFCVIPEPGGLEAWLKAPAVPLADTVAVLTIGPIAGPSALVVEESTLGGVRRVHVSSGPQDFHGTPEDGMMRVDFRGLLKRVELLYQAALDLLAL